MVAAVKVVVDVNLEMKKCNEGVKRKASNGCSGVSNRHVIVTIRAEMMAGIITS